MAEDINRLKDLLQGNPEAESEPERVGFLKAKGMSVEQFSRAIGVTRTAVYFYLKDRSRPTLDTLVKICEVVGIPLAEGKTYITPRPQGGQFKS